MPKKDTQIRHDLEEVHRQLRDDFYRREEERVEARVRLHKLGVKVNAHEEASEK